MMEQVSLREKFYENDPLLKGWFSYSLFRHVMRGFLFVIRLERYGCFQKWWYPTTMGFPTKNDHFGVFWEYPYFWKHPCPYICFFQISESNILESIAMFDAWLRGQTFPTLSLFKTTGAALNCSPRCFFCKFPVGLGTVGLIKQHVWGSFHPFFWWQMRHGWNNCIYDYSFGALVSWFKLQVFPPRLTQFFMAMRRIRAEAVHVAGCELVLTRFPFQEYIPEFSFWSCGVSIFILV